MPISKLKAGSITGTFDASKIGSGTFADARIAASNVSQHATSFDDDAIQSKIALLGFKTATNGSLAAYNLTDQVIDEFTSNAGINTSSSTNETLTSGYFKGAVSSTPTITHDADETGTDGDFTWYKWTDTGSTGSYSTNSSQTHDFLVVAGGGAGGSDNYGSGVGGNRGTGGGGAGGLRTSFGSTSGGGASAETDLSLVAGTTYTITVGAGGAATSGGTEGTSSNDGSPSSITGSDITDITTVGGGAGNIGAASINPRSGGSGAGGYGDADFGSGTSGQGYNGGGGAESSNQGTGGGGGGAGSAGTSGTSSFSNGGGNGGAGLSVSITGSAVTYAGGGGGGTGGTGGAGGGGNAGSTGGSGTNGLGGGGGATQGTTNDGSRTSGAGGSGVVILRRQTNVFTNGDLTLQSTSKTASSVPSQSDFIMLMENGAGTATLNTDVKAFISRDGGSTFTQGTLVEEGTYETNKKILAFHDLDISSQPSGTNLVYKITTHNQSVSKETRIHAASIGWR